MATSMRMADFLNDLLLAERRVLFFSNMNLSFCHNDEELLEARLYMMLKIEPNNPNYIHAR